METFWKVISAITEVGTFVIALLTYLHDRDKQLTIGFLGNLGSLPYHFPVYHVGTMNKFKIAAYAGLAVGLVGSIVSWWYPSVGGAFAISAGLLSLTASYGIKDQAMTERYMSYTEVAEYLNVAKGSLAGYKLPEPDVYIGRTRGWKRETIETWNVHRPGKGNHKGR